MDSIFEKMLQLPLFQGVTLERMSQIAGKAKFNFLKILPGNSFIHAGETCSHLTFMINGKARLVTTNSNDRFRISQTVSAPAVLMPQYMFGRETRFPGSATAIETVNLLQVSKEDYLNILKSDPVFTLNYLNMLATGAQLPIDGILSVTSGDISMRLALWVVCLTQAGATDIEICCKKRDLYAIFGVPRGAFMTALDQMRDKKLLDYDAQCIFFKDRRSLVELAMDDNHF